MNATDHLARYERQGRTVLKDPERRRRAMADLPTEKVEEIIEDAHAVARDRMRARRAEQETEAPSPTTRDLMGDDHFDPSESWADNLIMRVNNFWLSTADELDEQIRIKDESNVRDENRIRDERDVVKFLREKAKELEYDPYPGLFHADIDRIYAMHGVTAPGA